MTVELVITCEHGGHRIPPEYVALFRDAGSVLDSHRGWDAGALRLARTLSGSLNAKLFYSTTSRLLVDLNRSVGHPRHFSEYSRQLSPAEREDVIKFHYLPYRSEVSRAIDSGLRERKTILHISVHSFTPRLAGRVRKTDVGLLYDPKRQSELKFAETWQRELDRVFSDQLVIHRNQPYRGTSDGFTVSLRQRYQEKLYLGIELEVSQKWLNSKARFPKRMEQSIVESLRAAIQVW